MLDKSMIDHPVLDHYFEVIRDKFNLTPREVEVIKVLTILGPSNRELGAVLNATEKTMRNHIANIQEKTGTHSTRELQAVIFRDTLVPLFMSVFKVTENTPMEGRKEIASLSTQQSRFVG